MNKSLEQYLLKKYPEILKDMYGDPKKTAMAWGISTDDGWFYLLDRLLNSIQSYINSKNKWIERYGETYEQKIKEGIIPDAKKVVPVTQVVAAQIKEKFSELRFYYGGGDDIIKGMVAFAENLSLQICEKCGTFSDKVKQTDNGWIKTLCPLCMENYINEKRKKNMDK